MYLKLLRLKKKISVNDQVSIDNLKKIKMPTFWKHKNILIQGENILIYRKKHQQSKRIKRTALHDLNWKDGLQKTNSSIDLVYDVFLRFFFSYVSFGG